MRVVIAVATANAALRNFLASNRPNVIPQGTIEKGYFAERQARFSVQIQALDENSSADAIGAWLKRISKTADAVILLIDQNCRQLVTPYEDAYFIVNIPPYPGAVLQNQVFATLAPILRHFANFCRIFDSQKNQKVLLLPLDIFLADELNELRARLTVNKMDVGFADDVEQKISRLNERARPKGQRRFKRVYFVDDRPLWFHFGLEQHAMAETGVPPHAEHCWHTSCFRFGRRFDCKRHFNVDDDSTPTKVFGSFITCHGETFNASGQSHLNVFPNCFI